MSVVTVAQQPVNNSLYKLQQNNSNESKHNVPVVTKTETTNELKQIRQTFETDVGRLTTSARNH